MSQELSSIVTSDPRSWIVNPRRQVVLGRFETSCAASAPLRMTMEKMVRRLLANLPESAWQERIDLFQKEIHSCA
jgi:hypothetical protein